MASQMKPLQSPEALKTITDRIASNLTDEPETFHCWHCRDLVYTLRTDAKGIMYSKPCSNCDAGRAIENSYRIDALKRKIENKRLASERKDQHEDIRQEAKELDTDTGDDIPF